MKKKLLAFMLSGVLLASTAIPAFAATAPMHAQDEILTIEQEYEVDIENTANVTVNVDELVSFIESAQTEVLSNLAVPLSIEDKNTALPQIFEMTALGEDYSLHYSKAPDMEPVVSVLGSAAQTVEDTETPKIAPRTKPYNFKDGIGLRVPIQGAAIKTLSFNVRTSATGSTQNPINSSGTQLGECYLYGGFSSSTYESDLGLIYQDTMPGVKGWKPYFLVKKGNTEITSTFPDPNNAQVTYHNGYIPGDSNGVGIEISPNYNNTNKIRLRTEGRTLYKNSDGAAGNAWLIQIIETKNTASVTSVNGYKILATGACLESQDANIKKARCSGIFTKISLGGATPVFLEAESDYGSATKDSANGYTLSCSKGF